MVPTRAIPLNRLNSRLKNEDMPVSSKIEIVLRHYGWTGERQKEAEAILLKIREAGYQFFPSAVALIE